jgi:hypothetical protein
LCPPTLYGQAALKKIKKIKKSSCKMKKIQLFYDSISLRGVKTAPERVFEGLGGDFGVELLAEVAYIYCISSDFDLYAGFDCGVDVDFDGGFGFRRGVAGAGGFSPGRLERGGDFPP